MFTVWKTPLRSCGSKKIIKVKSRIFNAFELIIRRLHIKTCWLQLKLCEKDICNGMFIRKEKKN